MTSPPAPAVDARDARARTPIRIRTTAPSAAPLVVPAAGRGSVAPLRFGRFLVEPGDRVALGHILRHHAPTGSRRQRWQRSLGLAALNRGFEGVAVAVLRRRYGTHTPGPLEVDAVWTEVRAALKSCGLTGVGIRVHELAEPAAGLAYGGDLVGFGRRGGSPEADHPLVLVHVRPRGTGRSGLVGQARALASVRGALPSPWRDLVPAPLAHRLSEKVEVLATGFVPGRALTLDLPRRPSPALMAHHLVAVAETLADLQNAFRSDESADGSLLPDAALERPWAVELGERLDVRPVPLVPSHGALGPDTLRFDQGRVSGIADWSASSAADVPTRDLFDFLLAYARHLEPRRGKDPVKLVRRAFVAKNRTSGAVRRALVAYGARRELGLPTLGGLFRLHILTRGARRSDGTPGPEAEREAVLRALEKGRETVFTP